MRKKVYDIHWMICMSIWLIVTFGCLLSFVVDNEKVENISGKTFVVTGSLITSNTSKNLLFIG